MKQALFDNWITALESGTIPQCASYLAQGNARCCLGVLLDVAGVPSAIVMHEDDDGTEYEEGTRRYEGTSVYGLPSDFAKQQGMDRCGEPISGTTNYGQSLAYLNDHGTTFSEIAQRLRADPLRYIREITP